MSAGFQEARDDIMHSVDGCVLCVCVCFFVVFCSSDGMGLSFSFDFLFCYLIFFLNRYMHKIKLCGLVKLSIDCQMEW